MSTSEILSTISLVSFVIAGISFLLAVFFWFRFNILVVIGDLSGRTARKSIEKMRANNEKTGNKSYKPSKTNLGRGKLTDAMPESDKLTEKLKQRFVPADEQVETGLLDENMVIMFEREQTALLTENEETGLLQNEVHYDEMETDLLQTDVLVASMESEETGLLVEEEETGLLNENMVESRTLEVGNIKFVLLEEVMLTHTNETID